MKIISDGTRSGTKLYTDSGEEIANVTEFTLQGTASGSFIIVKIKLLKPKVEFEIEDNKIEWIILEQPDEDRI